MIAPVNLTGHELTAASSAVAALAIVGGYLGVRSANRNAVEIAREERSSRRRDELDVLKRIGYARCVAALLALNTASIERSHPSEAELMQKIDAAHDAHEAVVGVEQIAPDRLFDLACEALASAFRPTNEDASAFPRGVIKLRKAMQSDLRGDDIPSSEELDRMADRAISNTTTFLGGPSPAP
jgi:hypothetical protein